MVNMSEWHRWDLHVHTPETMVNDNFTDDNNHKMNKELVWKRYCRELNNYGAEAVGITDYFSANNFFKLRKNRNKWKLNTEIVIFPNIELRATDLVSKKRDENGKATSYVNIHLIFRPEVSETLVIKFLRETRYKKANGKTINLYDDIDEIVRGNDFVFLPTTKDILEGLTSAFGETFTKDVMIMIPNSGDGISLSNGNGSQNGKDFLEKVDLIQARTGNARNDRQYLLQKENRYMQVFPSVTGCDAHAYLKFSDFPANARTWIKSELSFEGLKQVVYEPEGRISIQESKPQALLPSKVIREISLNQDYFSKNRLEFSEGLNTIIGGRSSGKSVLLSIMAKLASGQHSFKKDNGDYDKLIEKLSSESTLTFSDGRKANGQDQIEFIYQDGLQEIARNKMQRNVFIEKTLKDIVSDTISLSQAKINNFRQDKRDKLRQGIEELKIHDSKISSLSEKLSNIQDSVTIKNNIEILKLRLNSIQSSKAAISREKINPVLHEIQDLNLKIERLTDEKKELIEFKDLKLFVLNPALKNYQSDSVLKIIELLTSLQGQIHTDVQDAIDHELEEIEASLVKFSDKKSELINSDIYIKYQQSEQLSPEIIKIQESIEKQEKQLSNYRKIMKYLSEAIHLRKSKVRSLEINVFFRKILNELSIYNDNSLKIEYKTSVNFNKFMELCQKNFKTNTNVFRNDIFDCSIDIDNISNSEVKVTQIIHNIINIERQGSLPFRSNRDIYDWFEDLSRMDFLEANYIIYYKRTNSETNDEILENFTEMSEGKQAFILLLMKLSLSPSDIPFFIDQPEDELDNKAIYEDLVTHLRKQKLTRQIFVVTHNANIVVGGDSECVTIAEEKINSAASLGHTFNYKQGPIESTEIQNSICETLEGGQKAFKIRESRYSFN